MHAGYGPGNRFEPAIAIGAKQILVSREFSNALRDHAIDRPPGIVLFVPLERHDNIEEPVKLFPVLDQLLEKVAAVPLVEDPPDIEHDRFHGHDAAQPWRALKRRFVLLMT